MLTLALRSWPRRDRDRYGAGLLEDAERLVAEAPTGPARLRALLGEASALVGSGFVRRWSPMRSAVHDLRAGWSGDARFALRTMRRRPAFSAVVIGSLGLGLGTTTAMASFAERLLLQPAPFERPDDVALIWQRLPDSPDRIPLSGPDAALLEERAARFFDLAFTMRGVDGSIGDRRTDRPGRVRVAAVTPDFFTVLGVEAVHGRTFVDGSIIGSEGPAIVLSDRAWQTHFGSDPSIVGREVWLNGVAAIVVGVMGADFTLPLPPEAGVSTDVDVWTPLTVPLTAFHRENGRLLDRDSDNTGVTIARLRGGVSLAEARDAAQRVGAQLRDEVPAYAAAGVDFDVRALQRDATAHARPLMTALVAASTGMLLVVFLNVAGLLVARAIERRREFALRAAIGGGRGRLLRQLVVEGALLAILGVGFALAVAETTLRLLEPFAPPELLPAGGLALDGSAVAATAVVGVAAAAFSAVVTGWRTAAGASRTPLRSATGLSGPERAGLRSTMVVCQVALSSVLLLGTGLLVRSVTALQDVRPGFEAEGALTFQLSMRVPDRYRAPARRAELIRAIETEVTALPDVDAAGIVSVLPLGGDRWTRPFGLPGQAATEWSGNRADFQMVSSGYFDALGTRLLEGRAFTRSEDLQENERVVILDETLARDVAPTGSAVDAVIGIPLDGAEVEARVVGVVEHVRHQRLDRDGIGTIYVPYRQEASRDISFVVRSRTGDMAALSERVRSIVATVDPMLPVYGINTLDAHVAAAIAPRHFALRLLLLHALLAVTCTGIGLYGLVAFEVSRRTRQIGIRLAVGAGRLRIVREVVRAGLRLALFGAFLGIGAGVVLLRAATREGIGSADGLGGLTYGVTPTDPLSGVGALAVVLVITVLATGLPALRASRIQPVEALRYDG